MQKRIYLLTLLLLISGLIFAGSYFNTTRLINVKYSQLTIDAKKQVDCLADNIYYEAGYEPYEGKKAVAFVTLNRLQENKFGNDICSVVKQKVNSTCQFSWFCENFKPKNKNAYEEARDVALHVYANYENLKDVTMGSLYYHADYVRPNWRNLEKTVVIGRHIFYKEK